MAIDCGVLFGFRNPAFNKRPWPDVYKDELDLIVASEKLGFGHAWLTEHHFAADGYSPSLMAISYSSRRPASPPRSRARTWS